MMYQVKRAAQREKSDRDRTGIPPDIRHHYEEASGLSFDDVRVHYHSQEPGKLRALAYTQGNQVYIAPGQERHLRHELGHVVQQKRGLVQPTRWMNGLPVNDDNGLERQAESGVISAGGPALGHRQDIIQGVFLQWMGEDGASLQKVDTKPFSYDTIRMPVTEIAQLLRHIKDPELIGEVSREMQEKLYAVRDRDDITAVFAAAFRGIEETQKQAIVNALDLHSFFWFYKNGKAYRTRLNEYFQARMGTPEIAEHYVKLEQKLEWLKSITNEISTVKDPAKQKALLDAISWDICGCFRLISRFPMDDRLREFLAQLHNLADGVKAAAQSLRLDVKLVPKDWEESQTSFAYADEASQHVPLPVLGLPTMETFSDTLRDTKSFLVDPKNIPLAGNVMLPYLEKHPSRERLVIYRSMDPAEAVSILRFFNSPRAAVVEQAVKDGPVNWHKFDWHRYDDTKRIDWGADPPGVEPGDEPVVPFGKHYGELEQAAQYTDGPNVLLAFILKPGAKELLFSATLLGLPELQKESDNNPWKTLKKTHPGFTPVSAQEGTGDGVIGIKPEQVEIEGQKKPTYSLCLAPRSRPLLQFLIDRVEIVRIKLTSGSTQSKKQKRR